MCFPTFAGALFSSSSDESLSSLLLDPALADAAAATLADAAATLADADATLAGTALGATKHKALELGCKKKQNKKKKHSVLLPAAAALVGFAAGSSSLLESSLLELSFVVLAFLAEGPLLLAEDGGAFLFLASGDLGRPIVTAR